MELEKDIENIKKQMQEYRVMQEKILMKLTGIENCLMGTEYERNNGGGLIKKVTRHEGFIECLNEWKAKSQTRNGIIYIILASTIGGLWTLVIAQWDAIFK